MFKSFKVFVCATQCVLGKTDVAQTCKLKKIMLVHDGAIKELE